MSLPWNEVWDMTVLLLAPALGTALAVMLLLRLIGRERRTPLAAALALAAGVLVGNHFTPAMTFTIDNDRPFSADDLLTVLGWSLEAKPPPAEDAEESPLAPKPSQYWLPWAGGLALLVELLARLPKVPSGAGWAARALVAVFAGRLLAPAFVRVESPWTAWLLGLTILLQWGILLALARRWKDGTVAAAVAFCFLMGSIVVIHAHSRSQMEIALLFFAALLGVAIVACVLPGDTGGALAAAAVVLPGLMLIGQKTHSSEIPDNSFILVGLAPLTLALLLLLPLSRLQRWRRWVPAILLPLAPALVGVFLAHQAEPLDFSEPPTKNDATASARP